MAQDERPCRFKITIAPPRRAGCGAADPPGIQFFSCASNLGYRESLDRQGIEELLRIFDLQNRARQMRGQKTCTRSLADSGLGENLALGQLRDDARNFGGEIAQIGELNRAESRAGGFDIRAQSEPVMQKDILD